MLTAARPVAARFLLPQSSVNRAIVKPTAFLRTMGTIADGVEFDTIAREWRCKVREMKQINVTFWGPNLPLGSEHYAAGRFDSMQKDCTCGTRL